MFQNPSNDELRNILMNARTIAVVGLSDNPDRESYMVSKEMQKRGYKVIPVNPAVSTVLGEKSYPKLTDLDEQVDIVNIFRRSEALPEVVQDAIMTSAPVIWAQQGIWNEEAATLATNNGRVMIMDRCIMVMHSLLVPRP